MKDEAEKKYIDDLIAHTEETLRLLSNEKKSERERMVCVAFLRCLGIPFSIEDIESPQDDPPDVIFSMAFFEIMEVFAPPRMRGDEYKKRYEILKNADNVEDTLLPYRSPTPISHQKIYEIIRLGLEKKANRYGKQTCSSLDPLVYPSLQNRFLNPTTDIPAFDNLSEQGWRSVSFVIPPYSYVVFANENAPDFLVQNQGVTTMKWEDPDTYFELN